MNRGHVLIASPAPALRTKSIEATPDCRAKFRLSHCVFQLIELEAHGSGDTNERYGEF
jgi:hypothetical protein